MRWLPFILIFFYVYIEISIFIKVAAVLGVALTLLLVILTSCLGASLVRNQGMKTLMQMQQKLAMGESPAAEMIKSVSLVMAGLLLLLPGFCTDLLGLLLMLPLVQKRLALKLLPYFRIYRSSGPGDGGGFGGGPGGGGHTFDGEFERKDDDRQRLDNK
ncbi:membrane protein FxsA [Edwardsiella ictaluri]|uniref:FxsA cytoplasmic membrane protein n=2 Tax=Edwardsiella ictaluri TaxID=67780 RepID=C5BDK3_EDWI9|nr:FxsA family protein [Edwardsiella ictaluri]ACR67619.1 FxsA cytoplasmic membrane protein [Edwardsiella ictaluri 93-146]ARD40115.1 membrane protein FxsA [Edwardsiella ictaluri]AVZ81905.1 membrane protein FxsA [Edwardsiella ictaluri]EKS7762245.1 FxsA family protein [Edwardsiella ictaluri]EKS7769072.1 FxsA family protein [Edwardsiella ictaluri]